VARLLDFRPLDDVDLARLVLDAADEIERLRAEIIRLKNTDVYLQSIELVSSESDAELEDILKIFEQRRQLLQYAMMIMQDENPNKNDIDTFKIVTSNHLESTT
jgi:hypothetical protein